FFSSRRRHTRSKRDWSSDVCSSDLHVILNISFQIESGLIPLMVIQLTPHNVLYLYLFDQFLHAFLLKSFHPNRLAPSSVRSCLRSEERRVGEEGRSQVWAAACEDVN